MNFKKRTKEKVHIEKVSLLSVSVIQFILLLACAGCVKAGQQEAAVIVLAAALLGIAGTLWTKAVRKNLHIKIEASKGRLFPGDTVTINFNIRNEKWLPVPWVDMIQPLKEPFVLRPDKDTQAFMHRMSDNDKNMYHIHEKESAQVLNIRCSSVGGYSVVNCQTVWEACRRGVMSARDMEFYTGDGMGFTRCRIRQDSSGRKDFVVYPVIVDVNTEAFTKNMWEGENSPKGVLEDVSLIKLTRPYQEQDSLKKINWRMVARGQQLTVNQYEVLKPKKIHFIFDGESFNGKNPRADELENALSVLASLMLKLEGAGLECGFSFPSSIRLGPSNIYAGNEGSSEILYRMAEYEMRPPKINYEVGNKEMILTFAPSHFDEEDILENMETLGKCYFVTFDDTSAAASRLFKRLQDVSAKVLVYEDLMKLKGGRIHD